MTFSLLAMDQQRRFMVAVSATKTLSVGASVMAIRPKVGGVLSQALTNSELRGLSLDGLAKGNSSAEAVAYSLSKDNDMETRQIAVMDAQGNSSIHTGVDCLPFAGGLTGEGFAVIGNLLAGPEVISSMGDSFKAVQGFQDLASMSMDVMRAGEVAGGDSRGLQSAAMIVRDMQSTSEYSASEIDIRVDDHADPLTELNRILKLTLEQKIANLLN